MSFLSKNTAFLGISLLSALAVAVGCSREEEDAESASSDIIQSQDLVISQVYGGGGNANAPFTHDFIELFNKSNADVSLDGKSLQYAASTGNFSATKDIVKLPAVTLKAREYFVVQLKPANATPAGGPLPKADYVTSQPAELIALSKEKGKIALASNDALLDACGDAATACDPAKLDALIDFVGYGAANQYEGVATPALGTNTAAIRRAGGCADTGNNGSDFDTTLPPAPHMTASPDCNTVDASVPPPPPAVDAAAPTASDAGDAGKKEAGAKPPKEAGAPKPAKEAGAPKSTTDGDDGEDGEEAGDDDDSVPTSSGSVTTRPSKKATTTSTEPAPPQFGATAPDACAMSSGSTTGSSLGFVGLFGLALAAAARRRRR